MALNIDVNVTANDTTSAGGVTSPTFSTSVSNELLLAFVSGGGSAINSINGAGLTWHLVGNIDWISIYRTFAPTILTNQSVTITTTDTLDDSFINVISFSGVDTSGVDGAGAIGNTNVNFGSGNFPSANLTTSRDNAWVWSIWLDANNTLTVSAGTNQTIVNTFDDINNGITSWVEKQNATTPTSGTVVTTNATYTGAGVNDGFEYVIIEILPAAATTSTTTTSTSSSTTTTSTSSSSSTTTTSTSSSSSTTTSTTTTSTSTTQSTTTSTSTTTTSTSTSSSTSTTLTLPYEFEVDRPDLQA